MAYFILILTQYWNTFHWEYVYLNFRIIFDKEFWFVVEKIFLGFDIGYWLEEALKFLSYEIPKESFMDISKIVLIFGISLLIYFAFLFLGFFLKNKNLKAQNLKKEE